MGCDEDSPSVKSTPPVEVVSSSGSATVAGLPGLSFGFRVEERVEMRVGRLERLSSEELEAELMAQSVSFSGENCQSRLVWRWRVRGDQ